MEAIIMAAVFTMPVSIPTPKGWEIEYLTCKPNEECEKVIRPIGSNVNHGGVSFVTFDAASPGKEQE